MNIVATADLHLNITRSREPTLRLAEAICQLEADVLMVLGDVGGHDVGIVSECLHLFDRFAGRKFFVAGNHDIWVGPGGDSWRRFEEELPACCRDADFHPLDQSPAVVDGVGFAGSVGWYDYSFRPAALGVPLRFYQAKTAPGAADRLGGYEHLLTRRDDIAEDAFLIGTRWMDGEHVRLPMSDLVFTQMLLERLQGHLDELAPRCEQIVVGMHHIPFRQMVPTPRRPGFAFGQAFLGSEMFGELLLAYPQVQHVFCGHIHKTLRRQFGHIDCINVGSTYLDKRYEMIEV